MKSGKITDNQKEIRQKAKVNKNGILQEDTEFSSPSAAAIFVTGVSSNGLKVWKSKDGTSLGEIRNNKS